jgi:hypothetical protein
MQRQWQHLGSQNPGRRQTKTKNTILKTKMMSNTDLTKTKTGVNLGTRE